MNMKNLISVVAALFTLDASAQLVVDAFMDFEVGSNGDAVTATSLNSIKVGNGTWYIGNDNSYPNNSIGTMTYGIISTFTAPGLAGPVSVGGVTYNGGGTRCLRVRHSQLEAAYLKLSAQHSKICVGYWWNPARYHNGSQYADYNWYDEVTIIGSGEFCVNSFENDGATYSRVNAHAQAGTLNNGVELKNYITQNNTTWFWVSQLYESGSLARISVYTTNMTLIGTSTISMQSGKTADEIGFGNHHDNTENNTYSYYNDIIVTYDDNAVFPLLPEAVEDTAPTINGDLADVTTGTNTTATFTLTATGSATLLYRWTTNTVAAWSTSNTLVFTGTTLAMSNTAVQCIVTNDFGSATSAVKHLYVTNGVAAPEPGTNTLIIMDDHRTVWAGNVGVPGGVPTVETIYTTLGSTATVSQINTAIANCPSNQVVKLGPGTFTITSYIDISTNGVVLRGSGRGSTILNYTGGGFYCVRIRGSGATDPYPNSVNWTNGYTRGTNTVMLSSTANLGVGSIMVLTREVDANIVEPNGTEAGDYASYVGDPDIVQHQYVVVTGISGSSVSITPPLMFTNWASASTPKAWWQSGASVNIKRSGVEDLTVDNSNGSASYNVMIQCGQGCWFKNIESIHGVTAHCYIHASTLCTIRDSYFHEMEAYGTSSYGLYILASSSILAENNLFYEITGPIRVATAAGCVVSYNYINWPRYDTSPDWLNQGIKTHGGHCYLNLFEGNITPSLYFDFTHGSSSHNLAFRNRSFGWDTNKTDNTIPLVADAWNRWENIVGNVLGKTGVQTDYERAAGGDDDAIYCLGFTNTYRTAGTIDTQVEATMLRHINYDTVNAAIVYDTNFSTTTLSNSYYLEAKPTWFGNLTWPPVNPSSPSDSPAAIPAGYYFLNGTNPGNETASAPSSLKVIGGRATFGRAQM